MNTRDTERRVREALHSLPQDPPPPDALAAIEGRIGKSSWRGARPVLLAAAVILLLAGVALVGLGPFADRDDPIDVIAQLETSARELGTYRFAHWVEIDGEGPGPDFPGFEGEGATDVRRGITAMTSTMGLDQFEATCELIVTQASMYMRIPEAFQERFGGHNWVRVPTEDGPLHPTFSSSDPLALVEALGGVEELEVVGHADVRGVPTTHYRGLLDQTPFIEGDEELLDELERAGFARVPVELWIDDRNLLRRNAWSFTPEGDDTFRPPRMVSITEFFDYGAPVDISEPDPEHVHVLENSQSREAGAAFSACLGHDVEEQVHEQREVSPAFPEVEPAPARPE